jgi:hypothetical protein
MVNVAALEHRDANDLVVLKLGTMHGKCGVHTCVLMGWE